MIEGNLEYYRKRAEQERAAAQNAAHAAARWAHDQLAQQYASLAGEEAVQTEMR